MRFPASVALRLPEAITNVRAARAMLERIEELVLETTLTSFTYARKISRSMGRLMSKYLDRTKVEQAFKRAARTAASGNRDARSGRFMVRRDEPKPGALANKRPRKEK
jgi:hypothetical protein